MNASGVQVNGLLCNVNAVVVADYVLSLYTAGEEL